MKKKQKTTCLPFFFVGQIFSLPPVVCYFSSLGFQIFIFKSLIFAHHHHLPISTYLDSASLHMNYASKQQNHEYFNFKFQLLVLSVFAFFFLGETRENIFCINKMFFSLSIQQ